MVWVARIIKGIMVALFASLFFNQFCGISNVKSVKAGQASIVHTVVSWMTGCVLNQRSARDSREIELTKLGIFVDFGPLQKAHRTHRVSSWSRT